MLITEEYKALNAELHSRSNSYGVASVKFAADVANLARRIDAQTVLDYGCGKQRLGQALSPLGFSVTGYDPAIIGLDTPPMPHDVVACIDVLEHIEPECLNAVLDDLRRVTRKALFLTIATRKAGKTLADGRNAHLIVEPAEWWLSHLRKRFDIHAGAFSKTQLMIEAA